VDDSGLIPDDRDGPARRKSPLDVYVSAVGRTLAGLGRAPGFKFKFKLVTAGPCAMDHASFQRAAEKVLGPFAAVESRLAVLDAGLGMVPRLVRQARPLSELRLGPGEAPVRSGVELAQPRRGGVSQRACCQADHRP